MQCANIGKSLGYGPYDYTRRTEFQHELEMVERSHFGRGSENLTKGMQQADPGPDLHYTLSAFPNHHRALNSAINLRLKKATSFYSAVDYPPAECYLERAVYFNPNDGTSFMLFGILLQRLGQYELALKKYRRAEQLEPNNPNVKYNLGLLLVDMEQPDDAMVYAKELYGNGFPLQGLKRKLMNSGHWD
ncbi:MAG: hypothetical protein DRR42_27275 [Gammaproteobacteria bacterium]|nr:MAG: hypothetical protein DRR42_27275 [Gammaproteobacteria bacterium]